MGVDVVADLPVGANLMEHPLLSVDYASRAAPGADWFQTAITCRSDHAGTDPYDLHLLPGGPVETEPGQLVFIVLVGLMRPQSAAPCRCARSIRTRRRASCSVACANPTISRA